jgi:hypothetical protein
MADHHTGSRGCFTIQSNLLHTRRIIPGRTTIAIFRQDCSPLIEVNRVDDGLGELAEPVAEAHLVESVDSARLQPVAAEGTFKIGVRSRSETLIP